MNKLILAVIVMTVALAVPYLAFRGKAQAVVPNELQRQQIPMPQTQSENVGYVIVEGEEVRSPGRIPFRKGLTLMSAIGQARGSEGWNGPKVLIIERGGSTIRFNPRRLLPDGSNNPLLEVGDVIKVR